MKSCSSGARHPLVEHLLVQRMYKGIPSGHRTIRIAGLTTGTNERMATSQLLAVLLNLDQRLLETGRYGTRRKLNTRNGGDLKYTLLLGVDTLDLFFDHLPDGFRYTHFQLVKRYRQLPMCVRIRD